MRRCFVVSICPVFVSKWSQSNPSGKNSVQGVDSRRLCIRYNFSLPAAQSTVRRQSGHFHSRLPGSSLVTAIGQSEPNCASDKLGNCRGLESPPEGTAGFQSIDPGDERPGIPHRSRRCPQYKRLRSPGAESRSPRLGRRRNFIALAWFSSSGRIDSPRIGICPSGTSSSHLHEGPSRQRVCARDAKPSCVGDGSGQTSWRFSDSRKQDPAGGSLSRRRFG